MKRKKLVPIPRLKKKIWKVFSEWVRREAKGQCFTCGTVKDYREMDAGHLFHGKLDFEPMAVHAQCSRCNRFLHGNLGVYTAKIIEIYGMEAYQELKKRSNQIWKPSRQELEEIYAHWQSELSRLKAEGN